MTQVTVLQVAREALQMTMIIAAPMLLAGLTVGLLVSLMQAVTQIQEATLVFIPKIIAVFLCLLFFAPWLLEMLQAYTIGLISGIPDLISPR